MDSAALASPVPGEDPCGPALQWDPEMVRLDQMITVAAAAHEAVVDGEPITSQPPPFPTIIRMAQELCARTKDVRVVVILAEASWHDEGLPAFAEALEALAVMAETWPDAQTGLHPRADGDDGDLGSRAAPLGRLMYQIPVLARTRGWGEARPALTRRLTTAALLRGVFEAWDVRIGPAFGPDLPSRGDAWTALQPFVMETLPERPRETMADASAIGTQTRSERARAADPWDLIDGAIARMTIVDRHSPALPVLKMLASWREVGITQIAASMKDSGISLEQMLESIEKQTGRSS